MLKIYISFYTSKDLYEYKLCVTLCSLYLYAMQHRLQISFFLPEIRLFDAAVGTFANISLQIIGRKEVALSLDRLSGYICNTKLASFEIRSEHNAIVEL